MPSSIVWQVISSTTALYYMICVTFDITIIICYYPCRGKTEVLRHWDYMSTPRYGLRINIPCTGWLLCRLSKGLCLHLLLSFFQSCYKLWKSYQPIMNRYRRITKPSTWTNGWDSIVSAMRYFLAIFTSSSLAWPTKCCLYLMWIVLCITAKFPRHDQLQSRKCLAINSWRFFWVVARKTSLKVAQSQ